MTQELADAANAICDADALLICAGAGIGVDSGLPDFRGNAGFWKAYPPLADAGIAFTDIATPDRFHTHPALAWGFYGHRLNLYRATVPHEGFALLKRWADAKPFGGFVFTSNVDGQFQKAGFDPARIAECHGSLHHLQCLYNCSPEIWSADAESVIVDERTCTATAPLPHCPNCGQIARPNVLMFNDWGWQHARSSEQEAELESWLQEVRDNRGNLAVIEIGAGRDIPTVRLLAERMAQVMEAVLVRINPRDCVPPGAGKCAPLPLGAMDALTRIAALLPK
ncbi:MAG: NAD-dependent deacetylase [Armatimonadetes bacterium]|nr:NAD-dependent deacetylase [Armatimonadota bacterium]